MPRKKSDLHRLIIHHPFHWESPALSHRQIRQMKRMVAFVFLPFKADMEIVKVEIENGHK